MAIKKLNSELFRRLTRWGNWRARPVHGLGYPSMTSEARLRESPGRSELVTGKVPGYWPDRTAIEVQKAISQLDNKEQLVLWCEYVQKMQLTKAAAAMGMELAEYRKWIHAAHKKAAKILDMHCWVYT